MLELAATQPGFLGVDDAREGDRHHRLVLDRRGGNRGVEAQRRPRVRAVRGPHTLVRRIPARIAKVERAYGYARHMKTRDPPKIELDNRTVLRFFEESRRRGRRTRGRREPRTPEAVDAVGRREVGRRRLPGERLRKQPHQASAARSGSTACSRQADPTCWLVRTHDATRAGHDRDRLLAARRRRRAWLRNPRRRGPHRPHARTGRCASRL